MFGQNNFDKLDVGDRCYCHFFFERKIEGRKTIAVVAALDIDFLVLCEHFHLLDYVVVAVRAVFAAVVFVVVVVWLLLLL